MLLNSFGFEIAPLSAPVLFHLGPIPISNALVFGLLGGLFTVGLLVLAARRSQVNPRSRLAYYVELLMGFIYSIALDSFGSRKEALKHFPLLATLFTFILVGNLSGILPGIGTINVVEHGHSVSLMRSFTTDLNATLGMAILTVGLVEFYAIKELGLRKRLLHFFNGKPWHPINFFIGINEMFSEVLWIVTLAMRLFGVIYAGEVLIDAVGQIAGNMAWFATVPTILLELFFSGVQAYVFMMLSATYLSMAVRSGDDHENDDSETERPASSVARPVSQGNN